MTPGAPRGLSKKEVNRRIDLKKIQIQVRELGSREVRKEEKRNLV